MRKSFIFYSSFLDALEELDDKTQLEVFRAIAGYALKDTEPNLSGVGRAIFLLIKPQLDANNKRYVDGCSGGRPKKSAESEKPVKSKKVYVGEFDFN
jgi:hypothetical protein